MAPVRIALAALLALTAATSTAADAAAQEPLDLDELERHGDLWVHPETSEPYTGPVVDTWDGDTIRERGTLVDGVWDGTHEWFHINGQLATRETWMDGELHGLSESYFKNGTLSLREMYVHGELHGPYEAYWTRGWLAERGHWEEGERCGDWESFGETVIYPDCS